MARKASMNGGLRFRGKHDNLFESIGELSGDIASLVELQAQLTAIDLKEAVGRVTIPTALLMVAVVVLLASLPVLLIGLGFILATAFSLSQGVAFLMTGLAFIVIAGILGFLAVRGVLTSMQSFRRSREELVRNVSWVRTVIAQSGKTVHRKP